MQLITVDDLVNHKVLPFDIYAENGKVIFSAGEILTPGKILQLKYIPAIYIDDEELDVVIDDDDDDELFEILDEEDDETFDDDEEDLQETDKKEEEKPQNLAKEAYAIEVQKPVVPEKLKTDMSNRYKNAMDAFIEEGSNDPTLCMDVRDSIIEEIIPEVSKILYRSQLKIYGDYNYVHGINVAMLSAVLAHKMKLNTNAISEITLAAMLHDIGKIKLPDVVINKTALTGSELKLLELHTRLGYNIIKNELKLPETVARVALQHHENLDGSGYPFGLSGDLISTESHIVSICNVYDQLTSGKNEVKVKNSKEAIKHVLELGTKCFKSDVLYTFVHMTNYNDYAPIMINNM